MCFVNWKRFPWEYEIMRYHMVKSSMLNQMDNIFKTINGATLEMNWSCVVDIEAKAGREEFGEHVNGEQELMEMVWLN